MKFQLVSICCLTFLLRAFGKMEFTVDEKIENCPEAQNEAKIYDLSNFEIVAESDTETFLNGTIVFLHAVEAPWKMHIYSEMFHRGQWSVYAVDKKFTDFCSVMHNPNEIWYPYMKDLKGCDIKVGVSLRLSLMVWLC